MNAKSILRQCRRQGIVLTVDGRSIRVGGGTDVVGDGLRELIRGHEAELIPLLTPTETPTSAGLAHLLPETSTPSTPSSTPFFESVLVNGTSQTPGNTTTYNNQLQEKPISITPSTPFPPIPSRYAAEKNHEVVRQGERVSDFLSHSYEGGIPRKGVLGVLVDTQTVATQDISCITQAKKGVLEGVLVAPKGVLVPPETTEGNRLRPLHLVGTYRRPPVGRLPIRLRQRWGDRANQLAEQGVPWPDDERRAYAEIRDEVLQIMGWAQEPDS